MAKGPPPPRPAPRLSVCMDPPRIGTAGRVLVMVILGVACVGLGVGAWVAAVRAVTGCR